MRKSTLRIVANERFNPDLPFRIEGYRELGKRKRLFFSSKRSALEKLRELQERLKEEGGAAPLSERQRADAATAFQILAPYPHASILDAVRHYTAHLKATRQTSKVSAAITAYLASKGTASP